jgi:hypothetical protein
MARNPRLRALNNTSTIPAAKPPTSAVTKKRSGAAKPAAKRKSTARLNLNRKPTEEEIRRAVQLVQEEGWTAYAVVRARGAPYPHVPYCSLHNHAKGRAKFKHKGEHYTPTTTKGRKRQDSNSELQTRVCEWADYEHDENNNPQGRIAILQMAAKIDGILADRDGRAPRWKKKIASNKWWTQLRRDRPDWTHRYTQLLEKKRDDVVTPLIAFDTCK